MAGGINTFGYVGGNPVRYIDPYGLCYGGIGCVFPSEAHQEALATGIVSILTGTDAGFRDPTDTAGIQSCASPLDGVGSLGLIGKLSKKSPISTGRTEPNNLNEKLAMEEVKSNPMGTTPPRMPRMTDTKNGLTHEDGWVKKTQNVNGVEVHYVENIHTKQVVDFKFKD